MYDYLIVGTGLYGSTFAWKAKLDGKKCLIIDKRNHIGGNIYCENIGGIIVHKYGPHIFHTSEKWLWEFVNQFTEFIPYTLLTIANYNGKLYNLPFNMNTFYLLWGVKTPGEAKNIIEELQYKSKVHNLEELALSLVGEDIYNILIKGYTEKLWGCKCSELPPYIIKRIPIRFNFDNNYFNDIFQGIPKYGYNPLIENLLEGQEVILELDFFKIKNWRKYAKVLVYTGPIDLFYNYNLGKLKWRSLKFQESILNCENFQGSAIINYTGKEPFTRIVEHKHFCKNSSNATVITEEFPTQIGDPYYPVDLKNPYYNVNNSDIIFGGRLGEYKYYNMDEVIKKALYDYIERQ